MAPLQQRSSFQRTPETPVRSPPSTGTMSKKKVTFHRMVSIRMAIALSDLTPEEKDAMWFTPSEFSVMREKVRNDVSLLSTRSIFASISSAIALHSTREGPSTTSTSSTPELRGLESLLPEGLRIKQLHRMIARRAVFTVQQDQLKNGNNDPEMLADSYFERNQESVATALVQGLADYEIVRKNMDVPSDASLAKVSNEVLFRSGSIESSIYRRQPLEFSCRAA